MQQFLYMEKDKILYPVVEAIPDRYPLSKYGRMRKQFLKDHRSGMYTTLLTEGILNEHCHMIEVAAMERKDCIVAQMRRQNPPPKTDGFMGTVRHNNFISDTAEQIVLDEIVLKLP
ncbi:TnpV protein [Christensenellaceae bacterium OttesenSCG-928-K19]|nr:TnpV protein [Christensenellaceae bacterium OttesenSCG-928-K19]